MSEQFFNISPLYNEHQDHLITSKVLRRTENEETFQSLVNFTSHLRRWKAFLEKNVLTQSIAQLLITKQTSYFNLFSLQMPKQITVF